MRTYRFVLAPLAAALVVTSCGSSGGTTEPTDPAPAATAAPATDGPAETDTAADTAADTAGVTVDIRQSRFEPTDVQVAVGATVTFVNSDPFAHTVTSRDGSAQQFDSGNLGEGERFEVTFDEAGTYDFFCQIHPTMRGTITVG